MDEKKYLNTKRAIGIVTTLTFIVAFFELIFAFTQYQQGMTIGDVYGCLVNLIPGIGETELARQGRELNTGVVIMDVIALVLISGIFKEIYFRGLAKRFVWLVFGEMNALILFNILFAVLDWHNLGVSFVIGFVWLMAYRKTNHLITPMLAHSLAGLFYLIYSLIMR